MATWRAPSLLILPLPFSSAFSLENCVGNEKLIVPAAESRRWKANFGTPSDNIPKAMGSAVIGLTSYRCGVDGAHGGASEEETWLYRLLHTRHQRRLGRRSVGQRFSSSLRFYCVLIPSPVSILASKISSFDPAIFLFLACPRTRGASVFA